MSRLVRLLQGNWVIGPYARWEFERNPRDMDYGTFLRDNETFETLQDHIRRKYLIPTTTPMRLTYRMRDLAPGAEEETGAPSNISSDTRVTLFMAFRLCYPCLLLCITVGALDCATYEFQCRRPFLVGTHEYLPENPTESDMAEYHELIASRHIMCVRTVFDTVFTENEQMMIYRTHLEIQYSNPLNRVGNPVNQVRYLNNPVMRDQIVLLDDDGDMDLGMPQKGNVNLENINTNHGNGTPIISF